MREFNLIGHTLKIKDDRERYIVSYVEYTCLASESLNKLKDKIDKYKNLSDMLKNLGNDGGEIIHEIISKTVKKLVLREHYALSEKIFLEEYYMPACEGKLEFFNVVDTLKDIHRNITLERQAEEEYRMMKKNMRGKWQGGGFGISGALKGATEAAALNMLSGLAYSTGNFIGDLNSSASANSKMRELFQDERTAQKLLLGIYTDVMMILFAEMEFLQDNENLKYDTILLEDKEKCRAVLENISSINIEDEKLKKLILQAIHLDPFNKKIYCYIIKKFGDKKYEIIDICGFLGLDKEINEYKIELLMQIRKKYTGDTKKKYMELKQTLIGKCMDLGLSKKNRVMYEIDSKIKELDILERTFEGVIYDSVEVLKKAKIEKQKIETIFNGIDLENEQSVLRGKKNIIGLNATLYSTKKYMDTIEENLEKIDKKKRTINGIEFPTHEEARSAINEKNMCESMINSIDSTNREEVLALKNKMDSVKILLIDKGQYLMEVDDLLLKHEIQDVLPLIKACKNDSDFLGLRQEIENMNLSDYTKQQAFIQVYKAIKEKYHQDIVKYKQCKDTEEGKIGPAVVMTFFLGIGLSFVFLPSILIALGLIIAMIISRIDDKKKAKKNKPAYDKIKRFVEQGYKIID